jgi:hypothetical protein
VSEAVENLTQNVQQRVLMSAQDFYGNSLGAPKNHLENTVGQATQGAQNMAEEVTEQAQDDVAGGETDEQAQEATGDATGKVQEVEGETTEETPGVVGRAAQGVGKAVGKVGRTARRLVPGMHLLSEDTDEEAGQTVQRTVDDESGDIVQTTLDESGEPVEEEVVGTVKDLPAEEEYTDEEGRTVRTVKEQRGALIHLKLGPDGSLLDLRLPPQKEEVKEQEVLEEGGRSESTSETS